MEENATHLAGVGTCAEPKRRDSKKIKRLLWGGTSTEIIGDIFCQTPRPFDSRPTEESYFFFFSRCDPLLVPTLCDRRSQIPHIHVHALRFAVLLSSQAKATVRVTTASQPVQSGIRIDRRETFASIEREWIHLRMFLSFSVT